MKMKSFFAIAAVVAVFFQTGSIAGVEDYCIPNRGPVGGGTCETVHGLPSATDPSETVTLKRCNFNIAEPGMPLNCTGNYVNPQGG